MKVKVIRTDSLAKFEKELNNFVEKVNPKDIKLSVQKDFLPFTTTSEYVEIYYGLITYEEKQ